MTKFSVKSKQVKWLTKVTGWGALDLAALQENNTHNSHETEEWTLFIYLFIVWCVMHVRSFTKEKNHES